MFHGNGISPNASVWISDLNNNAPNQTLGTNITTGDTLLSGLKEYSNFYKYARIYASSLHLEVFNDNSNIQTTSVQAAPIIVGLITLPIRVASSAAPYNSGIEFQNTPYYLNSVGIDKLIQYPRYKYKYLGDNNNSTVLGYFKSYGKTKTMLGYSRLEDNQGVNCFLGYDSSTGTHYTNPTGACWYHYVRFDAPQLKTATANETCTVRYIVKMKYYVELFGYRMLYPDTMA